MKVIKTQGRKCALRFLRLSRNEAGGRKTIKANNFALIFPSQREWKASCLRSSSSFCIMSIWKKRMKKQNAGLSL